MSLCQVSLQLGVQGVTSKDIKSSVESYIGSKNYLKKIVPLTICNIIYHRLENYEHNFEQRQIDSLKFMVFKPSLKHISIQNLHSWSKSAMEALEKNYLKELYLYIKDKETKDILETYRFMFSYSDNNEIHVLPESSEVIKRTANLLSSIESLNEAKRLPDTVEFEIELSYYDNVPNDYEPRYFEKQASKPNFEYLSKLDDYISLGCIRTGYHKLKCQTRGAAFKITPNTTPSKFSKDGDVMIDFPLLAERSKDEDTAIEEKSLLTLSEDSASVIKYQTEEENTEVICPCEIKANFAKIQTALCNSCFNQQHMACLGHFREWNNSEKYICNVCAGLSGIRTNDKDQDLSVAYRRKLAVLRLAVVFCKNNNELPNAILEKCPPEIQRSLWNQLQSLKVILVEKHGKIVNMPAIDMWIMKNFDDGSQDDQYSESPPDQTEDSMLLIGERAKKRGRYV